MKNIITIQHTQSIQHTNGMIGSWTDWDLTEKGKEEAENIGRKLSEEYKEKDFVLYSSTLKRASQTAETIKTYFNIDVNYDDSLKERNLGKAVGKSVQWLRDNMENQEKKTINDRFFDDGESRRDLWNRLIPFYKMILESEDQNIIIVSHGDTLSVFNAIWLDLGVEFLNSGNIHGLAGGVSFLHLKADGKKTISGLSDTYYKR